MTIPVPPNIGYNPNPYTYQTTTTMPKYSEVDPKLLEVLERIADALEELAY